MKNPEKNRDTCVRAVRDKIAAERRATG